MLRTEHAARPFTLNPHTGQSDEGPAVPLDNLPEYQSRNSY